MRRKKRTDRDRDGKKENLEGRGEHMAEEPDGVRRNVKIAVRKSVSEWSEEGESECREVSCRLHRGREKSQSSLTQQHWNKQTRDDTKPRRGVPQPFCLSRWVNASLYASRATTGFWQRGFQSWREWVPAADSALCKALCVPNEHQAHIQKEKQNGRWGGEPKSKKSRCYSLTPILVIWPQASV